jgi:hypothetical protein
MVDCHSWIRDPLAAPAGQEQIVPVYPVPLPEEKTNPGRAATILIGALNAPEDYIA